MIDQFSLTHVGQDLLELLDFGLYDFGLEALVDASLIQGECFLEVGRREDVSDDLDVREGRKLRYDGLE